MYRYKVKDSDGDISIIELSFDKELGRIVIESGDLNTLVALCEFRQVPTAEDLKGAFEAESLKEVESISAKLASRIKSETLLALMRPSWCENGEHLREAVGIFEACQKMCLQMSMITAAGDKLTEELPLADFHLPRLRFDNLSFLWDAFVYYETNKSAIQTELTKKIEEIRKEYGLSADAILPWELKYWVLPVKIYDDLKNIVLRIPYEVMSDFYESTLEDESNVPIDVTDEIAMLIASRKNRNN